MTTHTSLIIHGGAGDFSGVSQAQREQYLEATEDILVSGHAMLCEGAAASDVVTHCVMRLEDNAIFNAGRGSVLNEFGLVEMDAGIMEGESLCAGAVGAVRHIRNPIAVARQLLHEGGHVLLVGEGAQRYARQNGLHFADEAYFITERRLRQLQRARRTGQVSLDHEIDKGDARYSTVGAVARDRKGDLAAGTSTGGMTNKPWGRVGDSPLIGAGVYADNRRCAVSATGIGEQIMRFVLSKSIAQALPDDPTRVGRATAAVMREFVERLHGEAGVILIDRWGQTHAQHTTQGMIHGWVGHDGRVHCRLDSRDGPGASTPL